MSVRIHSTAIIEQDVEIGPGTSIWDSVHIRHGARIGVGCIIGEKSYIAYDVKIGDRVKINASVYICAKVTIDDWAMISAGTVFTNDRFPRAVDPATCKTLTSEPTAETLATHVGKGVTIGANVTVGPGIKLGDFSMVGMGSVITRSVSSYNLVVGNPARVVGFVCACGQPLVKFEDGKVPQDTEYTPVQCESCSLEYHIDASGQLISDKTTDS